MRGNPGDAARTRRMVDRHELRIRTVAVSFGAAVSSAHHDIDANPVERDAMIELWRAWSLSQLERYGSDIDDLDDARPELGVAVAFLRAQLARSVESVRRA